MSRRALLASVVSKVPAGTAHRYCFNMAKRLRTDSLSPPDEGIAAADTVEPATHTPKYASLEPEEKHSASTMRCLLPPHKPLSFPTYDAYDTHYQQDHTNRCSECKKNFPTAHFLNLHLAENHDPIVAARREKGEKTYACFVDGCDKVCGEWTKRRSHLVDKHGFPRNYDFFVVNSGIDGRRSMLRAGVDAQGHRTSSRERRSSSATEASQTTEATSVSEAPAGESKVKSEAAVENDGGEQSKSVASEQKAGGSVDELTSSMSALKMVPRSITFGRRKGRAGLAKS